MFARIRGRVNPIENDYFTIKLRELKQNRDKLEEDVQYIQTVGSRIAQFYILDTKLNDPTLKLKDIAEIWFKEIEGPLNKIASTVRKKYSNKLDKANYFAIHTLFYLLTGRISSQEVTEDEINQITEAISCPFLLNSWNYISILMNTGRCLCMCYASYIRAAAEEYHLQDYIKMCEGERSYSIVTVNSSSSINSNPVVHIGIGFKKNNYKLAITSNEDLTEIVGDVPALKGKIVKEIIKEKCTNWDDIIILMNRITDKRDSTHMITELLYVGIIYEVEDLIDNVLLVFLINQEINKYYKEWNKGKLSWKDYNTKNKILDNIVKEYKDNIKRYPNLDRNMYEKIMYIPMRLVGKIG